MLHGVDDGHSVCYVVNKSIQASKCFCLKCGAMVQQVSDSVSQLENYPD